jgi:hypothetical protein
MPAVVPAKSGHRRMPWPVRPRLLNFGALNFEVVQPATEITEIAVKVIQDFKT